MLPDLPDRGPVLPGSWEELYRRARRAEWAESDEAAALYGKIIDRLSRMRDAQLQAGNGYLALLRDHAAERLFKHHLRREEYDEALAVARRALGWSSEPDLIEARQADVQSVLEMSGRTDEAIALVRESIETGDTQWSHLARLQIEAGRYDDAEATLGLAPPPDSADLTPPEEGSDSWLIERTSRAFTARLYMNLAIARRQWDAAIAWRERVLSIDRIMGRASLNLFGALVRAGEHERTLRAVAQEQDWLSAAALWKGLALRGLGREREARRAWQAGVANEEDSGADSMQTLEWVLCCYYLGQHDDALWDRGLDTLTELIDGMENEDPIVVYEVGGDAVLYLAALDNAHMGMAEGAHFNAQRGAAERRARMMGTRLPAEWWYHFEQLGNPALLDELRDYFEIEEL